jgi:hypothetical protein
MPAYVIADIATRNLALMDETLEGEWRPNRLLIIEFQAGRTSAVLIDGA